MVGCLGEAFAPFRAEYTPAAFDDTVVSLPAARVRWQRMNLYVAEDPSAGIVGTIASSLESIGAGHLRGMAVRPAWQGRGIAEALLTAALADLRAGGCHRVTLETTLPLRRAARFYAKHGFRRSGKVSDFFGMPLIEFVREIL